MYSVVVGTLIEKLNWAVKTSCECSSDGSTLTVRSYNHLAKVLYKACDDAMEEIPETLEMPVKADLVERWGTLPLKRD